MLDNLDNGSLQATAQPDEGVTYAAKLSKAEAELDFSQPAEQLARKIRAFNPWPVARCALGSDRLRLLMASVEPGEQPACPPGTLLAHGEEHLRIACGAQGRRSCASAVRNCPAARPWPSVTC